MNARVPPAKMEALAQTMSTPTHVPVGPALLAFTVKPTSLTVLKALASMEGRAQIKSTAIPALAVQASRVPTVNTRSMSVTPSRALMEASAKMP